MRGDHEQARGRDRVRISEYLTVPELAQMVRRNRRTLHRWIATGEIGETDGLFVVQERFLIHGPTFRAKQFKPREKLRGQVPAADGSSQAANVVETPLALDTRRRSFCGEKCLL
jgi:hypothetical protein